MMTGARRAAQNTSLSTHKAVTSGSLQFRGTRLDTQLMGFDNLPGISLSGMRLFEL
jgi:hypothetical protein